MQFLVLPLSAGQTLANHQAPGCRHPGAAALAELIASEVEVLMVTRDRNVVDSRYPGVHGLWGAMDKTPSF